MDTKDDIKKEETTQTSEDTVDVSLDDMMAQAVEVSEDPKTEEEAVVATIYDPEETSVSEAPTTEGTDETPTESDSTTTEGVKEESTEEKMPEVEVENEETPEVEEQVSDVEETPESKESSEPEETSSDMIDEANQEAKDEETEVKPEELNPTPSTPLPPRKEYKGKWYIVHTYSGHENKVAKTLMQRVQAMGFEERIYDALVPTRDTIRVRGGKKETIKEKIFPGYILVNMDLSDEAWVLVRTTPGVTSFVGAQNKPTPIRDDEVQAIVAFVGQKDPVYKAQFSMGEAVKITDGPFSDFLGTVESIDEAKGKIKVLVSIFGRETPVELDFLQVAKI
jgi:transcription termination/antitermination protein NusG